MNGVNDLVCVKLIVEYNVFWIIGGSLGNVYIILKATFNQLILCGGFTDRG